MENFRNFYDSFLRKRLSRRRFLRLCLTGLAFIAWHNFLSRLAYARPAISAGRAKRDLKGDYDLVVARGQEPYKLTVKAIQLMGGMGKFVKKKGIVVIKPNMSWDRLPQQAANTNPEVVSALVDLCFEAGAKRVNVFDITCNDARRCYENSGIEKAAKERGAHVYFPDKWNVLKAHFSYKSPMEGWPIVREALECDTFINVPILKHHGLTGLTLSMKNLMGVCTGNRGLIHSDIGRKLVDLTDFISPDLTVIDAFRVLIRNGPTGGNLNDVLHKKTVLVATDPTLADSFASRLAGTDPLTIPYIKSAVERNFGNADIDKANILNVDV